MEDKLKSMAGASKGSPNAPKSDSDEHSAVKKKCLCHRLSMYVLDLSQAIDQHVVTWLQVKSNASLQAPEETILYSLTRGRSELIMFGGIQKDVSAMMTRSQTASSNDFVSNSSYFLEIPFVVT